MAEIFHCDFSKDMSEMFCDFVEKSFVVNHVHMPNLQLWLITVGLYFLLYLWLFGQQYFALFGNEGK